RESRRPRQLLAQSSILDLKLPQARCLVDDVQQLRRVEWLLKEPVRTTLHRFQRRTFRIAACNNDDLQRRILRPRHVDQRESLADVINVWRQVEIADDYVDVFLVDLRARILPRRGLQYLVIGCQRPVKTTPHGVVVIDNQNGALRLWSVGHLSQSLSQNRRGAHVCLTVAFLGDTARGTGVTGMPCRRTCRFLLSYAGRVESMVARRETWFQRLRLSLLQSCRHSL